jgi:hypothetical protein
MSAGPETRPLVGLMERGMKGREGDARKPRGPHRERGLTLDLLIVANDALSGATKQDSGLQVLRDH